MKIGLALSGGGIRAAVFHLGVLKRIAESSDKWENISFISSVSGGSLCVALLLQTAKNKWPDKNFFIEKSLPSIKNLLTNYSTQRWYIASLCCHLYKYKALSCVFKHLWGIKGSIKDLPDNPRWEICATSYETGKCWRFSKKRMGDYLANYVVNPDYLIADAITASASVPGLIGPVYISSKKYKWHKYENNKEKTLVVTKQNLKRITLWDGGVYDNLGIEPLLKVDKLKDDIDFIIQSDASRPLGIEKKFFKFKRPFYIPPFRLIDVISDQTRAIRSRELIKFLQTNKNGILAKMGNTVNEIYKKAKDPSPNIPSLSQEQVDMVNHFDTTLRKLTDEEFELILQHGYEVATYTLKAYGYADF